MQKTIPVGLVGVTGYTGMELVRLVGLHPVLELVRVTSRSQAGKKLDELFPHYTGFRATSLTISEPDMDELAAHCELVFLAVPHGTAMDTAAQLRQRGVRVVDLSADFRLADPAVYARWYGLAHRHVSLLETAVFGLPELYADAIARADLVANPGCYPTSVILGLYPALQQGLIATDDIVIDSKSGATGAGRTASVGTLFCEVADTFRAYNLGTHRHTPEIEQELAKIAGSELRVSFNTHLLPVQRGILSTVYTRLHESTSFAEISAVYTRAFAQHPWVRILPEGILPQTRWVRGTMLCDIGLVVDQRTGRLIIVSVIDNLCRGAAGQAVANANLMCGLEKTSGLECVPFMP